VSTAQCFGEFDDDDDHHHHHQQQQQHAISKPACDGSIPAGRTSSCLVSAGRQQSISHQACHY
jgi:hypothetical protein